MAPRRRQRSRCAAIRWNRHRPGNGDDGRARVLAGREARTASWPWGRRSGVTRYSTLRGARETLRRIEYLLPRSIDALFIAVVDSRLPESRDRPALLVLELSGKGLSVAAYRGLGLHFPAGDDDRLRLGGQLAPASAGSLPRRCHYRRVARSRPDRPRSAQPQGSGLSSPMKMEGI